MPDTSDLRLTPRSMHLCIDMQLIFSEQGPWPTPWMPRVLPNCIALAERAPERTIFTRFIPPPSPSEARGAWRPYYEHWRETTRDRLDPRLVGLLPELAAFAPPALVVDKPVYSAFAGRNLATLLSRRGVDTLVLSGAETDVCVLSTALGAIDLGFFVVIVRDAVCSSSDEGHDALMTMFERRFSRQLALADTATVRAAWTP